MRPPLNASLRSFVQEHSLERFDHFHGRLREWMQSSNVDEKARAAELAETWNVMRALRAVTVVEVVVDVVPRILSKSIGFWILRSEQSVVRDHLSVEPK